jgi:hypothetical protein
MLKSSLGCRYSTLDGTKDFIARHSGKPLQPYEALMRVDPSLTKKQARVLAKDM